MPGTMRFRARLPGPASGPCERNRPLPYYWFAVGNYMVFYVVMGDVMEVRRLIYGARDLTKMLP